MKVVRQCVGVAWAFLFISSLSLAQNSPLGCWEVASGKSVNKIEACQQGKICGKVVGKATSGRPNASDVAAGKLIIDGAVKHPANQNLWTGEIFVFALENNAKMKLTATSSTKLDVEGCYQNFPCRTVAWKKVACP